MGNKFCPLCNLTRRCNPNCALWLGEKRGCSIKATALTHCLDDTTSTIRQFLNGCDNFDFVTMILLKVSELERKHCNTELDDNEMREAIESDFIQWLNEEVE